MLYILFQCFRNEEYALVMTSKTISLLALKYVAGHIALGLKIFGNQ